jgi:hypothetical protein
MASSGSVDFSVNRNEIIEAAMRAIGALGASETAAAADIEDGAEALNMMVKQWQGVQDFAPGLKMWSRKRATLFLTDGDVSFNLGPSGAHWTASYVETTISADEAIGQTTLSITSETGISASDYILVEQNDGTFLETTVSSTGSGTVTVASALTVAASSGRKVFAYTTKARRPLHILTAVLRDSNSIDTPLSPITLEQYEAIGDKATESGPSQFYYEQQLTNGVLYLDSATDDILKKIRVVYLSPIEDFDAQADTPDYPQEWYRALKFGLAVDLWPEFKGNADVPGSLKGLRDESVMMAQRAYPARSVQHFQPGLDW